MKCTLTTDYDSHWYVIPTAMRDEWDSWCEATQRYYEELPEGHVAPMLPIWADRIWGAPSRVTFNEYKIE